MQTLQEQMRRYYRSVSAQYHQHPAHLARVRAVWDAMDRHAAGNPSASSAALKARLHEQIAESLDPVIFPHSPFFYEMGLRHAENWGTPAGILTAGSWLLSTRGPAMLDGDPDVLNIRALDQVGPGSIAAWHGSGVFDADHHCLGYSRLMSEGVNGLLARIDARLSGETDDRQRDFLHAAARSCRALVRAAERFAEKARAMLADAPRPDERSRRFLSLIAETAGPIPARAPRTFYEGLAMLWFCREAAATFEAVGISVIGHVDRQLIDLYRGDLAAGRLTEAHAADLLARWMLPTDMKFHLHDSRWPETSTCLMLGGCDDEGRPVFNELTRMVIEVHHRNRLVNPKLNCRYSAASPGEYLELVSKKTLAGHNVFALLNDDVLIPACVRAGKTLSEARRYVNGGCQETIVEGVEHSAGAYYYFNLARALDLCLQPAPPQPFERNRPEALAALPAVIEDAGDFESYYGQFFDRMTALMRAGAEWRSRAGSRWPDLNPCPLLSSTLAGCIENARDYSAGGAKYNPSGIALVGLGTVVDSLSAIREAVFEQRWLSLGELRAALAADWKGHEPLRARMLAVPKFGHGHEATDRLAERFLRELSAAARSMPNERGDRFQPSLFVYYNFVWMGQVVRATPDGRACGEMLSQGCTPSRTRPPTSLTDVFRSLARMDFRDQPGNSVLDVQLPAGGSVPAASLAAAVRTFAHLGGPTLQINCASADAMRDAQVNPDRHRDLTVRISGLSAQFVCLERSVQDEIIHRTESALA